MSVSVLVRAVLVAVINKALQWFPHTLWMLTVADRALHDLASCYLADLTYHLPEPHWPPWCSVTTWVPLCTMPSHLLFLLPGLFPHIIQISAQMSPWKRPSLLQYTLLFSVHSTPLPTYALLPCPPLFSFIALNTIYYFIYIYLHVIYKQ